MAAAAAAAAVTYLPGPDTDDHVVLVAHAHHVFAIGGEGHARDAEVVHAQLADLLPLRHVP